MKRKLCMLFAVVLCVCTVLTPVRAVYETDTVYTDTASAASFLSEGARAGDRDVAMKINWKAMGYSNESEAMLGILRYAEANYDMGDDYLKCPDTLYVPVSDGIVKAAFAISFREDEVRADLNAATYFPSIESAAAHVRDRLKNGENVTVKFNYSGDGSDACEELEKLVYEHNGKREEGDTLNHLRLNMQYLLKGNLFCMAFGIPHGRNSSELQKLYAKEDEIIASLNLSGLSEYEMVRKIHDWVCSHVAYDYDAYYLARSGGMGYESVQPYTAVFEGRAVCAGYSTLFYQLCLTAGIDCRYVSSTEMNHAWNIVSVDGRWYHVDTTWDRNSDGTVKYDYFLKTDSEISDHTIDLSDPVLSDPFYTRSSTPYVEREGQAMYRMYNPNSGEHFYTASIAERKNLMIAGWKYEKVGWFAPETGDPVYRLYNSNAGEHHYTVNEAEKNLLVNAGWKYEGIGWYSGGDTAVYREYNPNAFCNNHNYTAESGEHSALVGYGWKDEGIGWYGLSAG